MNKEKAYDLFLTIMDSLHHLQVADIEKDRELTEEDHNEINKEHRELNRRIKKYLNIK